MNWKCVLGSHSWEHKLMPVVGLFRDTQVRVCIRCGRHETMNRNMVYQKLDPYEYDLIAYKYWGAGKWGQWLDEKFLGISHNEFTLEEVEKEYGKQILS